MRSRAKDVGFDDAAAADDDDAAGVVVSRAALHSCFMCSMFAINAPFCTAQSASSHGKSDSARSGEGLTTAVLVPAIF